MNCAVSQSGEILSKPYHDITAAEENRIRHTESGTYGRAVIELEEEC